MAQTGSLADCTIAGKAGAAWCRNDTSATIALLEEVSRSYHENGIVSLACLKLGELYTAQGRYETARAVLQKGLTIPLKNLCFPDIPDSCRSLFKWSYLPEGKARMCMQLSQLALQASDISKALEYMILADTQYLPYKGNCANGMIDFQARITPQLAHLHLLMGDTAKAIDRLFKFLIYDDEIAKALKPLLLATYTQQQIDSELDRGIHHLKKITVKREGWQDTYLVFSVFDHELLRTSGNDKKGFRRYLRKNRSLKLLRNPDAVTENQELVY